MRTWNYRSDLSPELQRELSYFLRMRNRYMRIVFGFWKFVFVWVLLLAGVAIVAEILGVLSRRIH
jgi:hypothetical protein